MLKKGWLLLAYIIVSVIAVLIPASEGYNSIGWKLFVGQVYALPACILVAIITVIVKKK